MRTLDYARGRTQRDEKRQEESWTPVYEPGALQRFIGWAFEVAVEVWWWVRFWR